LTPSGQSPHILTRTLRLTLRIGVAAGLTGYMLWKSHPGDVLAAAKAADWRPMAVAVLLVLVDRTLMAYRWVALLCTVDSDRRPPLHSLLRVFFVSTFLGTFLPASIGSDALRSYGVIKLNVGTAEAVASVVMDRIFGIASVLTMGLIGLAIAGSLNEGRPVAIALGTAGIVCLAAALLVFSRAGAAVASRLVSWLPGGALRAAGDRGLESMRTYAKYPAQLFNVFVCSLAVQAIRVIQAYYLGRGLGLAVPLTTYFALVPLILLVMLLPVTFNGIGTSQAAFVWSFGQVGVKPPEAFALSILFVALGIVGNLPGGFLYIRGQGSGVRVEG
jgi:glycosyltransferase 2 family protein